MVFDMVDTPSIHQGSCMSIFKSLTLLESVPTTRFSRTSSKCHPWSLRGCWRYLRGDLIFDILNVPRMHQRSYISIFGSLLSLKVVQLLGSPERHPSVFLGV